MREEERLSGWREEGERCEGFLEGRCGEGGVEDGCEEGGALWRRRWEELQGKVTEGGCSGGAGGLEEAGDVCVVGWETNGEGSGFGRRD